LLLLVLLLFVGWHYSATAVRDRLSDLPATPRGYADDASHLNRTRVAEIVDVSPDDRIALQQIRQAIARARAEHRAISIAGFRHTMGGHTIAGDGIVLNMLRHDHAQFDRRTNRIHVGAGATWDLIIPYLDRFGRSVAIMQSDSPFSVGGSISVNCHGWQPLSPPIVASVESFRIVTPDGQLRRCSRSENAALFALAIGGYGLFGVILDVELRTVPNEQYRYDSRITTASSYEQTFDEFVDRNAGLAFGRVGVGRHRLLGDAVVNVYRRTDHPVAPLTRSAPSRIERLLFRGSVRSAFGKRLRWTAEKLHDRISRGREWPRNDLMDGDIEQYVNRRADDRDILHEYFVPRGQLAAFLADVDRVLGERRPELLNITLRDVQRDEATVMSYARRDMFAVVMFFAQRPDARSEAAMAGTTRALIDAALRRGGTYYLPYRSHATPEQFRAAYPRCGEFFASKRAHDSDDLFRNQWYERYGRACERPPPLLTPAAHAGAVADRGGKRAMQRSPASTGSR
jgi:FAD/FMN-containing dehydrogenase